MARPEDRRRDQGIGETTDWPVTPPGTAGPRPTRAGPEPDGQTVAAPLSSRPPQQPPSASPAPPPGAEARRAAPTAGGVDPHGVTVESAAFTRPPQPPPSPAPSWGRGGGYSAGHLSSGGQPGPNAHGAPAAPHQPTYQQPPAPPPVGQPAPAAVPAPPARTTVLADRRLWVAGGAAALAVVVGVALVSGRAGDDAAGSEASSTTAAQVPAAPITTVAGEPAPETPSGAPAPPPPPPAPPVASGPILAADALGGLLLPAEQVGQRLNVPAMTSMAVESTPLEGTITPPNCAGAWGPVYASTYNGSGYTGLAVQGVSSDPAVKVAQAVVSFRDPAAAAGFFDKQSADWSSCQSTHVAFSYGGSGTEVDVGVPAMTGDIMTLKLVPTTSPVPGQQCERAMTVRGNVVVDVRTCSPTVGSSGLSIASDIAAKIR